MKFQPRDYQQLAHDAGIEWIKKSTDPACIMAPTGAGKALLCAMLAKSYTEMAKNRKVLMLVPSATLVRQNHATCQSFLESPVSRFSASAGEKCLRYQVVIGTPQSIKNQVGRLQNFGLVIIDECHETTPTIRGIIENLRQKNTHLRVIGLTATPFLIGTGYIYRNHYLRGKVPENQCSDNSYFHTLIYEISARMLIDRGYLTPPVFGTHELKYDTSGLTKNRMGNFDASTVDTAFVGKGRLTSQIVADVVEKSRGRNCVLWFAATIQHAHEIAESLPREITRVVTGEMPKKELEQVLKDYSDGKLRHIVNVAMLHRGFDSPKIDTIAVLRATESAALYLQIIGRGLRLFDGKTECLVLDYAENLERHAPHGDIFEPEISSYRSVGGSGQLEVTCPLCNGQNVFSARKNEEGYLLSNDGYFTDLGGIYIKNLEGVAIPSHYGRRCLNETLVAGRHIQCEYRWSHKECPECGESNDIAAKYCSACRAELVDPNEKLAVEAAKMASDPYRVRIEKVESMNLRRWPSSSPDKPDTIRVDYHTELPPHCVSEWLSPEAASSWMANRWVQFAQKAWPGHDVKTIDEALMMKSDIVMPSMVAFKKKAGSKFFEVMSKEWK